MELKLSEEKLEVTKDEQVNSILEEYGIYVKNDDSIVFETFWRSMVMLAEEIKYLRNKNEWLSIRNARLHEDRKTNDRVRKEIENTEL